MLITQNSNRAATAQQLDCFMKTFVAIEKFNASTSTQYAHVFVDVTILQRLIDRAVPHVTDRHGKTQGLQLPIPDVAQNKDDWPTAAQFAVRRVCIVDSNIRARFVQWHRGQFQSTDKICAQSLKMTPDKPSHLAPRFFFAERDLNVAKSKAPVLSQNKPSAEAERVPKRKRDPQWQEADQDATCAVK